jgi:excisionase family DNA binding protein
MINKRNEEKPEIAAYTIKEFCKAYRISKPTFYRLARIGQAPKCLRFGNTRRIPITAAIAWEKQHLADTVVMPEVSADRSKRARGA